MSTTKNQHYVPQAYLKHFANDQEQVWVFDKVRRKSYPANVRNTASETYFYDFDVEAQQILADRLARVPDSQLAAEVKRKLLDPQFVEHEHSEMEAGFATAVDEVIATVDATGSITREQQEDLAYYLTRQWVRGPDFRKEHLERREKMLIGVSQMLLAMQYGEEAASHLHVRLKGQSLAFEHAAMMYNPTFLQTCIEILLRHIWHVGIVRGEKLLYTSDTPLVMRPHLDQPFGIGSPGVEIMFPLDPRHILVLHERQHFARFQFMDRQSKLLTPDNVLYFNSFQVHRSYRHVYSLASDFELAVNICAETPEVCEPGRDRIATDPHVRALLERNA